MNKIVQIFMGLVTLIIIVIILGFGTLQDLWLHDLKNKSIDKIKSYISSEDPNPNPNPNPNYDLMTQETCKATITLILMGENLPFEEMEEREKNTTFEVVENMACITKIGNETTGMFLLKDLNIISVDPRDIEKAIIQLKNF